MASELGSVIDARTVRAYYPQAEVKRHVGIRGDVYFWIRSGPAPYGIPLCAAVRGNRHPLPKAVAWSAAAEYVRNIIK